MSCHCGDARQNVYLFLDNEIDDGMCAEIREHIEGCAECQSVYDVEQAVKSLVGRSCAETAPDVLRTRIITSIRSVHIEIRES